MTLSTKLNFMKLCEGDIYQMCLNLNERADFVSVK